MISKIKQLLYFPIASYFRLFAQIQLALWKPKIIVVTGSNAKTTLLHLLESQIGNLAKYSHKANSAFGIPFDILRLRRQTFTIDEWPKLFLMAPINAFKQPLTQKIYIVEADCDRPKEGQFLSGLLNPDVTIWINISKSHSANFPNPVENNIAFEYGYFLEKAQELVIINGDSPLIKNQIKRTKAKVLEISNQELKKYQIKENSTEFSINNKNYVFSDLLPKESYYQIMATIKLTEFLKLTMDDQFSNFVMPPGRSSQFRGIKNTTLIDSSYNATPASMKAILQMFKQLPVKNKWLVLGDMVELGTQEKQEHEKLAEIISEVNADKIILIGPRLTKYTFPKLKKNDLQAFEGPKEALDYIKIALKGKEVLLFKGARFLEGIIEHLLLNKADISKLCRREKIWQQRRKEWGL